MFRVIVGVFFAFVCGWAAAQAPPVVVDRPSTPPTAIAPVVEEAVSTPTLALLRKMEARHAANRTLHVMFTQLRHDNAFDEDIRSKGQMWYERPTRYRCDYEDPEPITTLILEDTFYIYTKSEDMNQVDYYKFESEQECEQTLDQLLLGFGMSPDSLVRRYAIHSSEDSPAASAELRQAGQDPAAKALLIVEPRAAWAESSPFGQLKVTIDKAGLLPEKIWYRDTSDSTAALQIDKIEFDVKLRDKDFDPKKVFPSNATYINKRDAL